MKAAGNCSFFKFRHLEYSCLWTDSFRTIFSGFYKSPENIASRGFLKKIICGLKEVPENGKLKMKTKNLLQMLKTWNIELSLL